MSGTRREDPLLSQSELEIIWSIRRAMSNNPVHEVTEHIISSLIETKNNNEFIEMLKKRI